LAKIINMKEVIDILINIKEELKVNANQALFLAAVKENIFTIDLPSEDLLDLIKRGFMKGNKVTIETLNLIDQCCNKVEKVKINPNYPKLTKNTGDIAKRLAIKFLGDRLTNKEFNRVNNYCKSNPLMVPFLFMFLEMFPTSDPIKNRSWNKNFKTEWDGVTLRRLTVGTANKIKQIWKTKDIGLFLLGTYIFIKHSYSNDSDKYFVKKIENYLMEYQSWYEMAEDMLDNGQLDHLLSGSNAGKKNSNTTVI